MDGSQITGSSSSYARKYALNGLFAIDDTKDSDATNTHGKDSFKKEIKKNGPIMEVIGKNNYSSSNCSYEGCENKLTDKVYKFSKSRFGKPLCMDHQSNTDNMSSASHIKDVLKGMGNG